MLKYASGDVFSHPFNNSVTYLIPHVCNDIGGFGSGFAGYLARFYPEVRENYIIWYALPQSNPQHFRLGNCQFVPLKSKPHVWVVNMIAQKGVVSETNPHPLKYGALVSCMNQVSNIIPKYSNSSADRTYEIVCPMFGSGLAGGNWGVIETLIEEIWEHLNVTVYRFEEVR